MDPSTLSEYLRETEHAIRHLYAGLDSCFAVYREALSQWDISRVGQPKTEQERARLATYLQHAGRYFDLKFSEATFSGAILQIAVTAIRLFSRNTAIPGSCQTFVKPANESVIPFCIGEHRHGVPVGVILYAGRNQYNHWDEELHPVTRHVFAQLARAHVTSPLSDLAFEITNPTITIYASEILLTAMQWPTYQAYEGALRDLLQPWST